MKSSAYEIMKMRRKVTSLPQLIPFICRSFHWRWCLTRSFTKASFTSARYNTIATSFSLLNRQISFLTSACIIINFSLDFFCVWKLYGNKITARQDFNCCVKIPSEKWRFLHKLEGRGKSFCLPRKTFSFDWKNIRHDILCTKNIFLSPASLRDSLLFFDYSYFPFIELFSVSKGI